MSTKNKKFGLEKSHTSFTPSQNPKDQDSDEDISPKERYLDPARNELRDILRYTDTNQKLAYRLFAYHEETRKAEEIDITESAQQIDQSLLLNSDFFITTHGVIHETDFLSKYGSMWYIARIELPPNKNPEITISKDCLKDAKILLEDLYKVDATVLHPLIGKAITTCEQQVEKEKKEAEEAKLRLKKDTDELKQKNLSRNISMKGNTLFSSKGGFTKSGYTEIGEPEQKEGCCACFPNPFKRKF